MVNFLDKSRQNQVPVGGIFTPNGIVSLWQAAMVYRFFSELPLPEEFKNMAGVSVSEKRGSGHWFYFADKLVCDDARDKMGVDFEAGLVWHFETKTSEVLNFTDDARAKFGEIISFDVNVKSLYSNKYRHEYHMIALPSAVNAYAKNLGYETAGFDLTALLDPNAILDDRFWFKMSGDPEAKEGEPNYYEDSVLWKQRAELWQSLGESDAKVFRVKASTPDEEKEKFRTTSDKLSNALGIASYPWTTPIWCKIVTPFDPKTDAVYNDKHLSIATIYEIYDTREEALSAINSDGEQSSAAKPAAVAQPETKTSVAVPAAWTESAEQWPEYLKKFKSANPNLIPPVVAKAQSELGVTEEELKLWWNLV